MIYPTIVAFINDPEAPARPDIPPGGTCGDKDDKHMTYLAMILRRKEKNSDRAEVLRRQAILLESIAPGDPCVLRMMQWHNEIVGI